MRSRCGAIALCLILLCGCSHTQPEDTPTSSEPVMSAPALASFEPEPTPSAPLWTEDEATALAQMVWGEARGVKSTTEQAACVWCVLNRCDEWNMTILEVVTAPHQFAGYDPSYPVDDELLGLCEDVLTRYFSEKKKTAKPTWVEFCRLITCSSPATVNEIIFATLTRVVKSGTGRCRVLTKAEVAYAI